MCIGGFEAADWEPFKEAFPVLFSSHRIISLDCGVGWRPVVWELCAALAGYGREQMREGRAPVVVTQIKQKFGELRFYTDHGDSYSWGLIHETEERTNTMCEACGKLAAKCTVGAWITTLCREHQEAALEWAIRESQDL